MRLQKEINIFAKEAMIKRFHAIETAVSVTKGNISAIISDSEIVELQNNETTMYSKLGKLDMSVSGIVQQYTDLTTKYDSVRDQYTAMDSKLATYKTSVDGLSANITQVSARLNNNYSTTETMNAAISAAKDEISLSVSKTYDNKIASLESWRNEASAKITDSAIIATVKSSAEWSNKADKKSLISQINMSTEGISIKSSLIKLEGLVTANNYFKINTDGSMETKSATIGGWKVNEKGIETETYQGNYGTKTQLLSNNGSSSIAFFDAKSDIGPSLISGAGGKEIEILPQTILRITAPDGILIKGKISSNKDAYFAGIETGKLAVYGTKNRVVNTDNYAVRSLYCYEMPSPVFGDVGEATLDESGKCIIMIDDIFSETIVTDIEYQVFLQKEGKGDVWVKEKNNNYFEISGTPGLKFAWEIKARQKDYETERLEIFDKDAEEYDDIDYASEAAEMVEKFYKELEVA